MTLQLSSLPFKTYRRGSGGANCNLNFTTPLLMIIFYATDIHGSEICFKKLLRAPGFYHADVLLLGGDMTGKAIQLIIRTSNEKYRATVDGESREIESSSLSSFIEHVSNLGLYPYVTTSDEVEDLRQHAEKADLLFRRLITRRLEEWMETLERLLPSTRTQLMICPGNDDEFFVDEILSRSKNIVNVSDRVLALDDYVDVVSIGYSNPTPWNTPREKSECELSQSIDDLMLRVRDPRRTIFN